MPTVAPAALVTGAPRVALPYGLFSTFTFRPGGDRWEAGVSFETLTCDEAGGIGSAQCDPMPTVGLPKDLGPNVGGVGEATPFTVYGHWSCQPVGYTPATAQGLATDHLLAREEGRVERAFWTGDLGNEPYLADEDETTVLAGGTAVSIVSALSMLEDYVAGNYGSQGVIHMTRGLAMEAAAMNLLLVVGGRLTTILGTPVAAGGGYPGSAPDGTPPGNGKSWAYVSPAVFGYRSEVFNSSSTPGDLFDRGHNVLTAIAERTYLLGYDPCGVAGVQVDTALV